MPECVSEPILRLTDGTTVIDFVDPDYGFWLDEWSPQVANYKRGGVWQNSSLAESRRLVAKQFDIITETLIFKIVDRNQDAFARTLQDLLRLLEQGSDYWVSDWPTGFIWFEARSQFETNTRYALIKRGRLPEIENVYSPPFSRSLLKRISMEGLTLILERDHWQDVAPGTSNCTKISNVQTWPYSITWSNNTNLPSFAPSRILQVSNEDIYAGDLGNILRTQDNGASWAVNSTLPAGSMFMFMQTANGDIYATEGGAAFHIFKTDDGGATWAINYTGSSGLLALLQTSNTDLFAAEGTDIIRSLDSGISWQTVYVPVSTANHGIFGMIQLTNGTIVAPTFVSAAPLTTNIYISTDGGSFWKDVFFDNGAISQVIQLPSGRILAVGMLRPSSQTRIMIWFSDDNAETWNRFFVFGEDASVGLSGAQKGNDIIRAASGILYMPTLDFDGTQNKVYRSEDNGETWVIEFEGFGNGTASGAQGIIQAADTALYVSATVSSTGAIFKREAITNVSLGKAETCSNEVYISNGINISNLTDIKIDNGGVFSDIFPISTFPETLLPVVPATNDAIYFGSNTVDIINTGPFSNLIFDIGTVAFKETGSFTFVWEYFNGIWITLPVQDNTDNGTGSLTKSGVNSINWEQPSDWITNPIDSITGYWVRMRVSAVTGSITPPTQQNIDIYTENFPYIQIDAAQVQGDISAIYKTKLFNVSDSDGRSLNDPLLWDNRIVIGLRSESRGTKFQAYLNATDEQGLSGVIVSLGTDTSFISDSNTPTGRAVKFDPSGSSDIASRVTFTLGTSITTQFHGKFHAFVRGSMLGGVAGEITIRLQVISGSGGITFTTETKSFQSVLDWELIDLGQINMPVGGVFKSTDLGDQTQLIIQTGTTSGLYAPDLRIYDLILMPVDEWSGDFIDSANTSDSIIGRNNDISKLIDIDSLTNPRNAISSIVKITGVEQITSIYQSITPSQAILQANADQKLWFLSAQTSVTGTDYVWIAKPEVSHSVQLFKAQRYLSLRGDR